MKTFHFEPLSGACFYEMTDVIKISFVVLISTKGYRYLYRDYYRDSGQLKDICTDHFKVTKLVISMHMYLEAEIFKYFIVFRHGGP